MILPVLMLALLIVIDFGRLFYSYVTLTNATRVAANFGATDPGSFTGTPNTTTYDAVLARETAGLNCPIQTVAGHNPPIPTYPAGFGLNGRSVATMTCDFALVTPLISQFFGGTLEISATSQFPIRVGAISNIGGSTTLPPPGSPFAAFTFTGVSGGTISGSGNVTGTAPVTINVADGSANAHTWDWDWGDGTAHEFGPAPVAHTYSSANTYTVRLTVTNTIGSSTTSRTVQVGSVVVPPPVAGFYGTPIANGSNFVAGGGSTGAPISGDRPLVIDFTNNSTNGGTAFSWDFGDGTSPSTVGNPQHQYSSLGIFTVVLSVTAPPGGTGLTRTSYVTVGCVVPNFANTLTSAAAASWSAADFTGNIRYRVSGNNGNGNPNPPGVAGSIVKQSIVGGTFITPIKQGGNYVCDDDILLDYAP